MLLKAGLGLAEDAMELLWSYYRLIVRHNDEYDLTRITRFEDFIIKHFLDSMIVSKLMALPESLLDIGTGAGFPGIPLKIIAPRISLVLAEQRKKRVEFLNMAVDTLGLKGVEVYPHGVTGHSFFNVKGVITRALESVDSTLARVDHFLPPGGMVIFMKGPGADEDLGALKGPHLKSFEMEQDREYMIGEGHMRRLLVFRKTGAVLRKTYRIFKDQKENREMVITSESNGRYRELKNIVHSDGAKKARITLVSGRRIIKDAVKSGKGDTMALVIHDGYTDQDDEMNALIAGITERGMALIMKKSLYNDLDIFNTGGPLLFVRTPAIPAWDGSLAPGCNLLVPFQDPSNLGSVVRSAAAFGVERIILLREAAHPYHPRSVRSSSGAVLGAPLLRGPSISELGGEAWPIFALDREGRPLAEVAFPERFLLLPGMEGPGVPGGLSYEGVAIPMEGDIDSLNAAIAASIALYVWRYGI